jgi:hypothetical protein
MKRILIGVLLLVLVVINLIAYFSLVALRQELAKQSVLLSEARSEANRYFWEKVELNNELTDLKWKNASLQFDKDSLQGWLNFREKEISYFKELLHWQRVYDKSYLFLDTVRWSPQEYNRLMDNYIQGGQQGYYWGNLGDWAFPLLEYMIEARERGYKEEISQEDLSQMIARMEEYLVSQPGKDEISERKLSVLKSKLLN